LFSPYSCEYRESEPIKVQGAGLPNPTRSSSD
jgi:hypothetical protein